MSAKVKLAAKLPSDKDFNGIDQMSDDLVETPEKIRTYVIEADVSKIVDDTDSGNRVPYLRIQRIEFIGGSDDLSKELRKMLESRVSERTGRAPLPYSDENDGTAE